MDEAEPDPAAELAAVFEGRYGELEREALMLRRRGDRQSIQIADMMARERVYRKLIEDQYQLLQLREAEARDLPEPGPVLTIPVHEAMDLPQPEEGSAARVGDVESWLAKGGETDDLTRPVDRDAADGPTDQAATVRRLYASLPRPIGLGYRPSPGLAGFALPRNKLRALGFNLIGVADVRLEQLAEEIAQAVALNRRFAPVIFTTTRAGLGAFRSRRLTYESLPVFDGTIARLTGIKDADSFFDMRIGYLIRKWRIQAVMNLGDGYVYRAESAAD